MRLGTWNAAFFNNFVMNNTSSVAVKIFMSKQSKQQGLFKHLRFISIAQLTFLKEKIIQCTAWELLHGWAIDQLTQLLDRRSVLDKLFFKMMYKECFISWCWSITPSIILGGFTAFQTSGLFKTKKIKFVPGGRAEPAPLRPQVYICH